MSTSPRPVAPASGGAARSSHDHVERPRQVEQPRAAQRGEAEPGHPAGGAPASADEQRRHAEHDDDDGDDDERSPGAIATATAVTISSSAVRRTRSRRAESAMTPSTRSSRRAAGSAVPMPTAAAEEVDEPRHGGVGDERRTAARSRSRPGERDGGVDDERGDARPGWSGTRWPAATRPTCRAKTSPTTSSVSPRPIRNSHSTLASGHARPSPSGWRRCCRGRPGSTPTRSRSSSPAGSSGNGRNSPTAGTRCRSTCGWRGGSRRSRGSRRSPSPSELSRHRRTLRSAPMYVSVSRARRYDVSRALPAVLQVEDLVVADTAGLGDRPRRASSAGVRGMQADQRPQRRPRLAEATGEQPDDQLGDRQQRPARASAPAAGAPPVSVATVRMRWRARSSVVVEVGPADLELLAVARPGLRARRRRGRRSGGSASTGRRRRRGT